MKKITKLIPSLLLVLAFSASAKAQWTVSTDELMVDVSGLNGEAANGIGIFYGGSPTMGYQPSNQVNEYNASTNSWSFYSQGGKTKRMASTTLGHNLFFGGGCGEALDYDAVNIYNTITGTWSTSVLSVARNWLAAAGAGTQVLFGGGIADDMGNNPNYTIVDIYDTVTKVWSTTNLSVGRYKVSAAACDSIIIFAGGAGGNWAGDSIRYNTVDIWNVNANSGAGGWITRPEDTLSVARSGCSMVALGTKIYIAGGTVGKHLWAQYPAPEIDSAKGSDVIDIYDVVTRVWTTAKLSVPRMGMCAAATNDYLMFAGGTNNESNYSTPYGTKTNPNIVYSAVDFYDKTKDRWISDFSLNIPRSYSAAVAVNDEFYVAGGRVNHIIGTAKIEQFSALTLGIKEQNNAPQFSIFPNPATNAISLTLAAFNEKGNVKIVNNLGQVVYSNSLPANTTTLNINIDHLAKGFYMIEVSTINAQSIEKFIKE